MKQGLSLRVSQHLALTPQLQQSIRLLQLSTLELSQEVLHMLDDNPFLEMEQEQAPREDFGVVQADAIREDSQDLDFATQSEANYSTDIKLSSSAEEKTESFTEETPSNWEGDGSVDTLPDDGEWGGDAPARGQASADEDKVAASELASQHESLSDFLMRQALALRLGDEDRAALHFLIGSLNDEGYLEDSLEQLATGLAASAPEQLPALLHHFTVALGLLQSFEPLGVGARSLAECLSLQLRVQKGLASEVLALALRVCAQPMELLARRDTKRLAHVLLCTESQIREVLAVIARLEPKPGRRFANLERNIVVPDVLVVKLPSSAKAGHQPRFSVQLNPDVMPRLRVHDIYANALKGHKGGSRDATSYAALQQRLQEARWFIKNIQQRFDTILRVSTAIVERQRSFFTHGELAMRPLVLREIADELGLHESTISRVTTAKYMATPFGTFELKYFFGSALGTESGGNASSTAVRALIKQFVQAENPKKPFSDSQLSDMLLEQGIECARRTVAKYREALRIAPTSLRKTL
jgi:RNA polymerase sigma-54 factor